MKILRFIIFYLATTSILFAQNFSYNMMTERFSLHNKKGKTICKECYLDVKPFSNGKAWVKALQVAFIAPRLPTEGLMINLAMNMHNGD